MTKEEELARRWMPGFRQGPEKRHAWEHPQDLVKVLTEEMSFVQVPEEEKELRIAIAWLHDIIEDGKKEDGTAVSVQDLREEGISTKVIADVLALTHGSSEPKDVYLARLKEKSARVKVVKCVDRICNLREGRHSFKDRRWIRYVGETYFFIFPLADGLPNTTGESGFLCVELIKAVEARRIGTPYRP